MYDLKAVDNREISQRNFLYSLSGLAEFPMPEVSEVSEVR